MIKNKNVNKDRNSIYCTHNGAKTNLFFLFPLPPPLTFLISLNTEYALKRKIGSGALSGNIFLVRIVENNKIDAHFRTG